MMKKNNVAENKFSDEFLRNLPDIPKSVFIKPFINKQQRRTFSKEEDARLKYLVDNLGKKSWEEIAKMMPFRNSRQCKERYEGYLSPNIIHDQFSIEDDMIILEKYNEIGPKWTKISKLLHGRSGNQVKNRFNTYLKYQKINEKKCMIKSQETDIKTKSKNIKTDDDFCLFSTSPEFQKNDYSDDNFYYDELYDFYI